MLNRNLRILLFTILLVTIISGRAETYFPNFSFYTTNIEKKYKDMETEFGKLERTVRYIATNHTIENIYKTIEVSHPLVSEVFEWSPDLLSKYNNLNKSEYQFLLKQIYNEDKTKLLRLGEKLFLIIRINEKLVLVKLNNEKLKVIGKVGFEEYYFPITSKVKNSHNPNNIIDLLSISLNKNSKFKKSDFFIGENHYESFYGVSNKNNLGFFDDFIFIRYKNNIFNFYSALILLILSIGLTDFGIFFRNKNNINKDINIFSSPKIKNKVNEILLQIEKLQNSTSIVPNETIESKISNETFIKKEKPVFILPFDLITKGEKEIYLTPQFLRKVKELEKSKNEILSLNLQSKREKVFNPELEHLIERIDQKSKTEEKLLEEKFKDFFSKLYPNETKELYQSLNELYDHDYHEHESLGYLKRISEQINIDTLCVSIYNRSMGCYMVSLATGLDDETRTNLVFQWNDPFLRFDKNEDIIEIFFNNKLKTNLFFRKKFSAATLATFGGMLVYPLKKYSVDGYLIFFYGKNDHITLNKLDTITKCLDSMIVPFLPIINGIAKEKIYLQIPDEDILAKIFQEMKEVTNAGLESCTFIKLQFESILQFKDLKEEIVNKLKNILKSGDRVLSTSPISLLIIAKDISEVSIRKEIDKIIDEKLNLSISFSKYPDEGKNFYNYL